MVMLAAAYRQRHRMRPDIFPAGREVGPAHGPGVRRRDHRALRRLQGRGRLLHAVERGALARSTIERPTLVLAAADDPMIPVATAWRSGRTGIASTREITPTGGHVGFVAPSPAPGLLLGRGARARLPRTAPLSRGPGLGEGLRSLAQGVLRARWAPEDASAACPFRWPSRRAQSPAGVPRQRPPARLRPAMGATGSASVGEQRLEGLPDVVGDAGVALGGGVDAVGLVELGVSGDAFEEEGDEGGVVGLGQRGVDVAEAAGGIPRRSSGGPPWPRGPASVGAAADGPGRRWPGCWRGWPRGPGRGGRRWPRSPGPGPRSAGGAASPCAEAPRRRSRRSRRR